MALKIIVSSKKWHYQGGPEYVRL
ncbi:hypothetical protein DOY81_004682, partial [Sarcophaga bullata]